jgi:hypothetical protein
LTGFYRKVLFSLRKIFFISDKAIDSRRYIWRSDVRSNPATDLAGKPATYRLVIINARSSGRCWIAVNTEGMSSEVSANSTIIAAGSISTVILGRGVDLMQ